MTDGPSGRQARLGPPPEAGELDAARWARASGGEILFTSLTKQAMPLIRYRTRDLTRLLPARPGPLTAGWNESPAGPTT